jgi:signal transduction histidine kinase
MSAEHPSGHPASSPAHAPGPSAIYEYVSAVVHDLRNPLGAAIGNLSFVRDGLADEQDDLGEAIDDAADAVRRVEALVDELVSVAQFEAGTLKLRPEPVDLAALISAAVEAAQREAGLRSVSVRVLPTGAHTRSIDADRNLMRRVVESLIWCGFRATPAKGVIELRSGAGEEGAATVTVACTGVIDASRAAPPAIHFARSIVTAHRGSLSITSEPDFATVIRLSWP